MPLFDARASLELTLFALTWVAVVFLALIAVYLHARLLRLERASGTTRAQAPYGHLVGRAVPIASATPAALPEMILVLSAHCRSCARILEELANPAWTRPTAIAWKDGEPTEGALVPARVPVVPDGPRMSAELGIGVTPFALELDPQGHVINAGPVTSLAALAAR